MSLKTLHLTNAWHKSSGGIGTFYRALLEAANQEKHFLRLVVPAEETRTEEAGEYGRIYHVASGYAPLDPQYRMLYPRHYLLKSSILPRILEDERPDLVEICDKYTLPYVGGLLRIGKLRRVDYKMPVVGLTCERMDENMAAYLSRSGVGRAFCRWYMKWIYFPEFDYHIANSDHTAAELRPASKGHKVRRGVWVCPMGADTERFSPERRSEERRARRFEQARVNSEIKLLLYAGRLAPEKNLPLLIETMQRLDNGYRLLVAGGGMLQESFPQECERRVPGRVHFLGHVENQNALPDLYADCDAFVHPNPREPFGIAPLEAMASGLPLLAPNAGGVISYANDTNAWLSEPNGEAFAAALQRLFSSDAERARRVQEARRTAMKYRWSSVTGEFLELYRQLHAQFHGQIAEPQRQPAFYSTRGNAWGKEIEA